MTIQTLTRRGRRLLFTGLLAAIPVTAAELPDLESLFPRQLHLSTQSGRLARVDLPAGVVAACRPDFSDLRILDASGQEVPYVIDGGAPLDTGIRKRVTVEPTLEATERTRTDPEAVPSAWRESYLLDFRKDLPDLPEGGAWELVLEVHSSEFVRAIRVITEGGDEIASGSVFRLRDPLRERLRLALPELIDQRLRIEIDGQGDGYLEPVFRLESSSEIAPPASNEFELEILSLHSGEGETTVELARPPGLIPDRLRMSSSTPAFSRPVTVWDDGPGAGDQALAEEALIRLPSEAEVADLELLLRRTRGDRLRVVIEDGDSPALADLAFSAVLRRPAILFSLAAGANEATLYFGGGRAHRPRYDLAALLPMLPASGQRGELAKRAYDPSKLAEVTLSASEPNPRYDPSPALAFAMRPGRQLDSARYTHRSELSAPDSADGLIHRRLDLATVAQARSDLGDLRVVDRQSRQWPYLIERSDRRPRLSVAVEEHKVKGEESSYTLALPVTPMVIDEMVVDPPAAFFERGFEVEGRPAGGGGAWQRLTRGVLSRRQGDRRKVRIPFDETRVTGLRLVVEDNQDAPLDLGGVELGYPATDLYFAAPAGDYALLVGDPEAETPRYELASVRSVVLAVDAAEAAAEPLKENPDYSAAARLKSDRGLQNLLLWGALGLAVVVLGWLSFRLTRESTQGPP